MTTHEVEEMLSITKKTLIYYEKNQTMIFLIINIGTPIIIARKIIPIITSPNDAGVSFE